MWSLASLLGVHWPDGTQAGPVLADARLHLNHHVCFLELHLRCYFNKGLGNQFLSWCGISSHERDLKSLGPLMLENRGLQRQRGVCFPQILAPVSWGRTGDHLVFPHPLRLSLNSLCSPVLTVILQTPSGGILGYAALYLGFSLSSDLQPSHNKGLWFLVLTHYPRNSFYEGQFIMRKTANYVISMTSELS